MIPKIIFKGSSESELQTQAIFLKTNVGKNRIRHGTTLSDIDFKNKVSWVWTTLR